MYNHAIVAEAGDSPDAFQRHLEHPTVLSVQNGAQCREAPVLDQVLNLLLGPT